MAGFFRLAPALLISLMSEQDIRKPEVGGTVEEPDDVTIAYTGEDGSLMVPNVERVILTPGDYVLIFQGGGSFIRSRNGVETITAGPEVDVSWEGS